MATNAQGAASGSNHTSAIHPESGNASGEPSAIPSDANGTSLAILPSEEEIMPVLDGLLRTGDLDKLTLRLVMGNLAEHFNVAPEALANRKKFVRRAIESFMRNYDPTKQEPEVNVEKEENVLDNVGEMSDSEDEKRSAGSKRRRGRNPKRAGSVGDGSKKKIYLTNLEKAVILAEPLAEFLSELVLPRTHVAKRINSYIREQKLQDPKDGRVILCDEKLKKLFNTDTFTFFSVNKLTSNLLYKVDEVDNEDLKRLAEECNERRLAEKQAEHDAKVASGEYVESSKKKQKVKGRTSDRLTENGAPRKNGLTKDMKLSDALAAVCGGPIMSRSQVVKNIWVYIKANNLSEKGKITCDEKLQAVFNGVTEVSNFGFNKYLSAHLTKIE